MAFTTFQGGGHSSAPMAEINTTPLVDVMLVLLVIFIITAPLFQQAVPIDLPKVDSFRVDNKPQLVHVSINGLGSITVNNLPVALGSLESALLALASTVDKKPEMQLRADRGTRYERITEVMATAQRAGITRIAFVTDKKSQDEKP